MVYMRVKEDGSIDAAKPVLEGLSAEQQAAVVAALGGQPVSSCCALCSALLCCALCGGCGDAGRPAGEQLLVQW